jgi:hypothetical protein
MLVAGGVGSGCWDTPILDAAAPSAAVAVATGALATIGHDVLASGWRLRGVFEKTVGFAAR